MHLTNKTCIITGGAQGIGAAAVKKLSSLGANVVIIDIDEEKGTALKNEISKFEGKSLFIKCDVSDSKQVQNAIKGTIKEFGSIDVIYNNASVYWADKDGIITDIEENNWNNIIGINLNSIYFFCKYGIPYMIESKKGGVVINTASSAGIIGIPKCDAYTASKGATVQLTKSMAAEYGRYNIRVNCIAPAAIMTPMMHESNPSDSDEFDENSFLKLRSPLRRYGTPEEIANIAAFLASDEARYINGAVIVADGGITINGDLSKVNNY
jgi:NAD(P)-dependent dehydrogenase (short-subunit alcohol dehydrogenase family)